MLIKQLLELAGVAHLPKARQLIESTLLQEGFKEAQIEFTQASSEQEAQQQINKFRDLVNRNQVQGNERNIDYWRKQGWEKFNQFVSTASQLKSTTQEKRSKLAGKSITIHEDSNWLIVVPLDKDASCFHGKNTDWCTTKPYASYFESYFYDNEVTLIYFLKLGTDDKWAIACHARTDKIEMFDRQDRSISEAEFQQQTGFDPIEYRNKVMGSQDVQTQASESRQIYREAGNRIKDKYPFTKVDQQLEADLLFVKNSNWILDYCLRTKGRWERVERILAQTAHIIRYVKDVLKGERIPSIERNIRDADTALQYAIQIIKGRWPEAEDLIAQKATTAWRYAKYCIGDRWPEAEAKIASNPLYASMYARDVIGGRWPEVETKIATNPSGMVIYAKKVIGGRWPDGERGMVNYFEQMFNERDRLRKSDARADVAKLDDIESEIEGDLEDIIHYADELIKGRWPDIEPYLKQYDDLWRLYLKSVG